MKPATTKPSVPYIIQPFHPDPWRFRLCIKFLDSLPPSLPGDIIECGVNAGELTFTLARWVIANKSTRRVYAADTFSGLPYSDVETTGLASPLQAGECYTFSLDQIQRIALAVDLHPVIDWVPGRFEETLEQLLSDKRFAFAFVDADLEQATRVASRFLLDRTVVGGIIGYHDYGFVRTPGVKIAVDDLVGNDPRYQRIHLEADCIFFRRTK